MSKKQTDQLVEEALDSATEPTFESLERVVNQENQRDHGISSHYNNPFSPKLEIPDYYGEPTGDYAGYRPLHQRIANATVAGAFNAESKAMEDYDSSFFTEEDLPKIEPRKDLHYAEFDEVHEYMVKVQKSQERIELAHESVRRAQEEQSKKVYETRIQELEEKLKQMEEFRLAAK